MLEAGEPHWEEGLQGAAELQGVCQCYVKLGCVTTRSGPERSRRFWDACCVSLLADGRFLHAACNFRAATETAGIESRDGWGVERESLMGTILHNEWPLCMHACAHAELAEASFLFVHM